MKNQKKRIKKIRKVSLEITFGAKSSYICSCLSIVEILYSLYFLIKKKNDSFILSKGHAAIGVYAVMNHFKILKNKDFKSFCKFNSKLGGHHDSVKLPGLNFSTCSLGHGLPVSSCLAFGLKMKKEKEKYHLFNC